MVQPRRPVCSGTLQPHPAVMANKHTACAKQTHMIDTFSRTRRKGYAFDTYSEFPIPWAMRLQYVLARERSASAVSTDRSAGCWRRSVSIARF